MLTWKLALLFSIGSGAALPTRATVTGRKPLFAADGSDYQLGSSTSDDDTLTIMSSNTFLMQIKGVGISWSTKPNLKTRASGYIDWFNKISAQEMPDVVVFEEIFSAEAGRLIENLCSSSWNGRRPGAPVYNCDSNSKFQQATAEANAMSAMRASPGSGVVILVKKGLKIEEAHDQVFDDSKSPDSIAKKGFWAVKVAKGSQKYWVLATHTQAYDGSEMVAIRKKQFNQMRRWVDGAPEVAAGSRLIYVGDMNIFTEALWGNPDETAGMLQSLGSPGAPANGGTLYTRGFWKLLNVDIRHSVQKDHLHYIFYDGEEFNLGDQRFDWVVVPSTGDLKLTAPAETKVQYLPMKHPGGCFASDLKEGTRTDDLSDHYALFAQICWGEHCRSSPKLSMAMISPLPSNPQCSAAITYKKPGESCTKDHQCEKDACGRVGGSDETQCCGAGVTTVLTKDYCKKQTKVGELCQRNAQCESDACGRANEGTNTLRCCELGVYTYSTKDYCVKPTGSDCTKDRMCVSGGCGRMGGKNSPTVCCTGGVTTKLFRDYCK